MTSMRQLNRRLLRWHRYTARVHHGVPSTHPALYPGQYRVLARMERERARRDHQRYGYQGGWWDGDPEDYGCCTVGEEGHPGPCVWTCSTCDGLGRCPNCGGVDDLGCAECSGSLSCWDCGGDGQRVEDDGPPYAVTEWAFTEQGLL